MPNKLQRYVVWSYGLFLGWLLSYLFNGPALKIVFQASNVNVNYLAFAYIVAPVVVFMGGKFYNFSPTLRDKIIKYGLLISFLGTTATMLLSDLNTGILIYAIVAVMGVFSGFFIAGWACYFVEAVETSSMPRLMAFIICTGNILYYLNYQLSINNLNALVLISLYLMLAGSYFSFWQLSKMDLPVPTPKIEPSTRQIILLMGVMFLLNIGGGLVQSLVLPLTVAQCPYIYSLTIILFLIVGIIVYFLPHIKHLKNIIIMAMVIVASGLILLMVMLEYVLPSYILIMTGYAFLDIYLWSFVAELGAFYGHPIKIFTFVMSANLMAVFCGNLLGQSLTETDQHMYLAVALAAVSTVAAFGLMPLVHIERGVARDSSPADHLEPREVEHFSNPLNQAVSTVKKNALIAESKVEEAIDLSALTNREREIYQLMIRGLKNAEIAEQSQITLNTLKSHARHIYRKLGVKNKRELILMTKGTDD